MRRGRRSGLYTVIAVHSTARGPSLGGCRMWSYEDTRAAVRDALRLSRAMTSKSAVAGLPLGGGKGVIMLPGRRGAARPDRRRDALLDFGDAVDQLGGRYVTAEDVGTSDADMTVIAEQTEHVAGLALDRGGSGDPSPWTALGVETAIRVTCERIWGTADLTGRSIAVIGLGNVGGTLARGLAEAGAALVLADVAPGKRALADELGARWAEPDEALRAEVDVVAPCALGGVLDHAAVPALRCRAIAGAANNQLASDDVAAELHARGILWTPDFVANAGGIINIAVELEPEGYSADRARARVLAIGETVGTVLDIAESSGTTPLAAAQELARRRLAEVGASGAVGPELRIREVERRVNAGTRDSPGWSVHGDAVTPVGHVRGRSARPRTGPAPQPPLPSPPRRQRHTPRGSRPLRSFSRCAAASTQPAAEPFRHAVPRRRQQLVLRARARLERRDDPALALQPVRDVLVELRGRIVDDRPVAGVEPLQPERAQPPQAVQVLAQRAAAGGDEHAPLAEHRVAGERGARRRRTRGGRRRGPARAAP